jgi:hypothetical protein
MNNRFASEMTKSIQAISAYVKEMVPPEILQTLTSGNIQKINEMVMHPGSSSKSNPITTEMLKEFEGVMKAALANSIRGKEQGRVLKYKIFSR